MQLKILIQQKIFTEYQNHWDITIIIERKNYLRREKHIKNIRVERAFRETYSVDNIT